MIKSQLISAIAAKTTQLPYKDVEFIVSEILETISASLSHGKRVEIRGFGSFEARYRNSRKAHNPKTGERVATLAKYVPHFTAGKDLRDRVNASRLEHPIIDKD